MMIIVLWWTSNPADPSPALPSTPGKERSTMKIKKNSVQRKTSNGSPKVGNALTETPESFLPAGEPGDEPQLPVLVSLPYLPG
jgi:hypothetical protein